MNVNIQNDPWISSHEDGRIKCQQINTNYTHMAYLIHKDRGTQNMEYVKEVAKVDQVEAILSIPIGCLNTLNIKVWRVDNSRVYSVKSRYKLLIHKNFYILVVLRCKLLIYKQNFLQPYELYKFLRK